MDYEPYWKKASVSAHWHSRDRIAERAIRGGGAEKIAPCHQSLQLPARVLFVGRASVARRAILEKSFSFRARRSRDRIAERAPRGGGLEICAWSSSLRQLPAHVLFVEQPSLVGKRIAVSRFGEKFSVRARAAPQAIFSRSRPKDRFIQAQ